MTIGQIDCPTCSADIPLAGDEKKGEELLCLFCGVPYRLTVDVVLGEEIEIEEDF